MNSIVCFPRFFWREKACAFPAMPIGYTRQRIFIYLSAGNENITAFLLC